jgi:hypothetical protein
MAHVFTFVSTDSANDNFVCTHCGIPLSLNIVGVGAPNATLTDGVWTIPDDVLQSVEPCRPGEVDGVNVILTKRQFLIQLLRSQMVTPEEAATLATEPPALMGPILASMNEEDALEARLSWAAMTQVERYSPLVVAAGVANNISNQDLDNFFAAAAAI